MDPVFGHVFIYEHCLPFDVSRAYDEAKGIKNPRIWTAERDKEDVGRAAGLTVTVTVSPSDTPTTVPTREVAKAVDHESASVHANSSAKACTPQRGHVPCMFCSLSQRQG
jgi:hypothetical protein